MIGLLNHDSPGAPLTQPLAGLIEEVALMFERQLASELHPVNALCAHVERYRGKMLRPTLVLVTGMATSPIGGEGISELVETPSEAGALGVRRGHLVLAAVVEMIHMATLVHDDVLDEAEIRRGAATINHLRGNEAAVILGDFLISNAFHLCSTLAEPAINLALGAVTNTVCAGELQQLHHRNNEELDEATYFDIIRRKTASLIGACCELGATISGAPDSVVAAMRRFGEVLGTAFQIQDDLLDITGEESAAGKTLGRDLDKGKLTLPLIRHVAASSPAQRAEFLMALKRGDVMAIRAQLLHSGAVNSSRATADALIADAKRELLCLPTSPARTVLDALADAVTRRTS